ncbi:uncharacterized protein LOC111022491 [Momordica charantia]|uniref:Uncharacterized protein LOC111022491 n=1 Tax=Momordica charantia TaxID=3673 RepID=A0A6J1DQ06_MOMCH|nr:uncharacterized protein LOC111022491 [Momordica charantia]
MGPELVQETDGAIRRIRARMQTTQSRQKIPYWLAPPPTQVAVHNVFHVSMLRKYVHDPSHVLDPEPLQLDESLCYEEVPIEILARETKVLRNRTVDLVKVLWRNHQVEEATWEREDEISAKYAELFAQ